MNVTFAQVSGWVVRYLLTIRISDILDIAIMAFVLYKIFTLVQSTKAASLVKGLLIFLESASTMEQAIGQTVLACTEMSQSRTGALIVFEREILLDDMVRSGTVLDAAVSAELLKNIFFVKAPMHDGAVIVRHGRVLGAGCMLPLSKNVNLSRDLGMRHRAGIGMSENSDAVVVIVSEETGSISVAIGGMLKRHLKPETLENLLRNELLPREEDSEDRLKFNLLNLLRSKKNGGEEDA